MISVWVLRTLVVWGPRAGVIIGNKKPNIISLEATDRKQRLSSLVACLPRNKNRVLFLNVCAWGDILIMTSSNSILIASNSVSPGANSV